MALEGKDMSFDTAGIRHGLKRAARFMLSINWFRPIPDQFKLFVVARSGVCDWDWYARFIMRDPDAVADAPLHFLRHGNAEGKSPSPLFDPAWYVQRFRLQASPLDALMQYVVVGDLIGLSPIPWFLPNYCRATSMVAVSPFKPVLGRYLRNYSSTGLPHPLFDQAWYLEHYPDVRTAGVNPLQHFLYDGIPEGRLPNPYFAPAWYLETYPDLSPGVDPFSHYVIYGAAEGRSPGPDFNARQYLDQNPDVVSSGMHALAHYLAVGRHDGRELGKRPLALADLSAPMRKSAQVVQHSTGIVDIVLPVYRDLQVTRDCIESVLASGYRKSARLLLYNDKSPEPAVTHYLREVAECHPEVELFENAENLGFVRTVNAGMAVALSRPDSLGALLLNSDTIVSDDWVQRLLAHLGDGVGSVTALSNNATICSWPKLGANALPAGMSAADVDALTREVNAGVSVDIPTGVGFCMLISRAALEKAGLFDVEAFGKGYGEENDFCMRSAKLGFRHLLAMDVFVEHVGEVSFADDSKPGKIIAQKIIDERYPDYGSRVARFCSMDPGFSARVRLTVQGWKARSRMVTVLFTHTWGGGTERAVQAMRASLEVVGEVIIIRPVEEHGGAGVVSVSHPSDVDGFEFLYRYRNADELAGLLQLTGARKIQIHHLVGFGASLRRAIALAGVPYSFHAHDYYTVCPQITLTDRDGNYCGEPDQNGCDACIAQRPSHGAADIRNWRVKHEWSILGAQEVFAPCVDTAARIQRYSGVPVLPRYHQDMPAHGSRPPRLGPGQRPYRIVLLGAMAPHKGQHQLTAVAAHARKTGAPLQFHVIGYVQGEATPDAAFTCSGPYQEDQLDDLIKASGADGFLFLSQAPETYSYTLTHALQDGRPIAANRLGAYTERLSGIPNSLMLAHDAPAEAVVSTLVAWMDSLYGKEQA